MVPGADLSGSVAPIIARLRVGQKPHHEAHCQHTHFGTTTGHGCSIGRQAWKDSPLLHNISPLPNHGDDRRAGQKLAEIIEEDLAGEIGL